MTVRDYIDVELKNISLMTEDEEKRANMTVADVLAQFVERHKCKCGCPHCPCNSVTSLQQIGYNPGPRYSHSISCVFDTPLTICNN